MSGVHHIHAWTLTSDKNVFSAHLHTDAPDKMESVLEEAHDLLREKFGFYFSTIQVETECLDEDHARDLDISALLRLPSAGDEALMRVSPVAQLHGQDGRATARR